MSEVFHFPSFFEELRSAGALVVSDAVELPIGGCLYHHRGARVPGYEMTFVAEEEHFSIEVDAVGPRMAWARFDLDAGFDLYVLQPETGVPVLAWMSDTEFAAEERGRSRSKTAAVGAGRFSFGCYLHTAKTWEHLRRRAEMSDTPFMLTRADGGTIVPDDVDQHAGAVPPELAGGQAPAHLGLVSCEIGRADQPSSSSSWSSA